jgi:phage shock protein PspC (stress-responsive transcriptional regulator)
MPEPTEPPREAEFFTAIRGWGITRGSNGVIGGVVEGVGARIGLAAVPARIITVVLAFVLTGLVALAYAAAWALLPDRNGAIIIQNFGRGVTNVGALLGIAVLTLIGLSSLDGPSWGPWSGFDSPDFQWGWTYVDGGAVVAILLFLGLVAAGVTALVIRQRRKSSAAGTRPAPVGTAPVTSTGEAPLPARNDGTYAVPPARVAAATGAPSPVANAAAAVPVAAASAPADGAPAGTAPAGTTHQTPAPVYSPPAPAYRPPAPPRPYVPGPGRSGYLSALAWTLLSAAGIMIADRLEALAVYPYIAWFSVWVVGLGVILAVVALTGRKLGFLGFVGIVMAALLGVGIAVTSDARSDFAIGNAPLEFELSSDDMSGFSAFGRGFYFDPTEQFSEFDNVQLSGVCWTSDEQAPTAETTVALREAGVTVGGDTEAVEVSLEDGVGLAIDVSPGVDELRVYWPERGLVCTDWLEFGTAFSATYDGVDPAVLNLEGNHDRVTVIVKEQS